MVSITDPPLSTSGDAGVSSLLGAVVIVVAATTIGTTLPESVEVFTTTLTLVATV